MLEGWTPVEVHEHFDADDNYTGKTVVTREPEWDESQVGDALALMYVERMTCSGCGHSLDDTQNPDVQWQTDDVRCRACANRDVIMRDFQKAHEKHKPQDGHVAPWDGVRFVTRRKT